MLAALKQLWEGWKAFTKKLGKVQAAILLAFGFWTVLAITAVLYKLFVKSSGGWIAHSEQPINLHEQF